MDAVAIQKLQATIALSFSAVDAGHDSSSYTHRVNSVSLVCSLVTTYLALTSETKYRRSGVFDLIQYG